MLVFALSCILSSCKKESVTPIMTNTSTSTIIAEDVIIEAQELRDQYIVSNGANSRLPWWVLLGLLDLLGGFISYCEGESTSGQVGQAVFTSALALFKRSTNLSDAIDVCNASKYKETTLTNKSNPYELAGIYHNSILSETYTYLGKTKKPTSIHDAVLAVYPYKALNTSYAVLDAQITEKSLNNEVDLISNHYYKGDFISFFNKRYNLSKNEMSLMSLYLDVMLHSNDQDSFEQFSIKFENLISSSSLPATSKEVLLTSMSIGRYSSNFWDTKL